MKIYNIIAIILFIILSIAFSYIDFEKGMISKEVLVYKNGQLCIDSKSDENCEKFVTTVKQYLSTFETYQYKILFSLNIIDIQEKDIIKMRSILKYVQKVCKEMPNKNPDC